MTQATTCLKYEWINFAVLMGRLLYTAGMDLSIHLSIMYWRDLSLNEIIVLKGCISIYTED